MEVGAAVIAFLVQRQGQASNVSGDQKVLCTQAARLGSLGGGWCHLELVKAVSTFQFRAAGAPEICLLSISTWLLAVISG